MTVLAWPAFDYKPFNPYNWLLNNNLEKMDVIIIPYSLQNILRKKFDIWHMHWPAENIIKDSIYETLIRFLGFFFLLGLSKCKGSKIVWTVHNVRLHDKKHIFIEKLFWILFVRCVDGYICHSNYAMKEVKTAHPSIISKKGYVIYHGHYKDWYSNKMTRKEARALLNLNDNDFAFLFIGSVRPYKNVKTLIKVFKQRNNADEKLIIAGNANKKILNSIYQAKGRDQRIIIINEWILDDDFQKYFNAADLVILPYKIMNSGMALLSLSFNCPLMMPKNPMLTEYQKYIGEKNLYLYDEILESSYLGYVKNSVLSQLDENTEFNLSKFNWNDIAKQTYEFYLEVK